MTTTTSRRSYGKVHPSTYRVMHRLIAEDLLTYDRVAELFGCSRSRVVQVTRQFRDN